MLLSTRIRYTFRVSDNGAADGHREKLADALRQWEEEVLKPALARAGERDTEFETSAGPVDRLYTPLDVEDSHYERDIGYPGEYPFTRGVQPTMYRGRFWSMRQYAGFGTAEETNLRFRHLLANGQTGLSAAFDLPTQTGYDSDDPMSAGEVGQVGVAIDTLDDVETLFREIPLDEISTSMTINAPASILVAMYIAAAEEQGHDRGVVMGTAQNDVLKEYVARGTYIFPPQQSVRLAADLITSRGGIVAIDAIFPETVGLVNLHRLHATFAKIFWRPGAEETLPAQKDEIKEMQDQGLIFIIARLDDETGIQVGHDLDISVFQGFYVDDLLDGKTGKAMVT